jgi:hypothetical protein
MKRLDLTLILTDENNNQIKAEFDLNTLDSYKQAGLDPIHLLIHQMIHEINNKVVNEVNNEVNNGVNIEGEPINHMPDKSKKNQYR